MRSVLNLSALAVLPLLVGIAAGCHSSPVTPSLPGPLVEEPPTPPRPPVPALEIEGLSVGVTNRPLADGYFYYSVRFLLRETSGKAGAIIENVWPVSPDGPDEGYSYGPVCFGKVVRVEAGSTLDVFLTDQGVQSLQCVPQTWAKKKVPELELIVTYKSEDGRSGTAKATGVVSNQ
jgi:hypothetical protein